MTLPDPQLSRWMIYTAATSFSTLLFIAVGAGGFRWLNRAATRVGVFSAMATVFCLAASLSAFLHRQSEAPATLQRIEWCQRVSCVPDATPRIPTRPR